MRADVRALGSGVFCHGRASEGWPHKHRDKAATGRNMWSASRNLRARPDDVQGFQPAAQAAGLARYRLGQWQTNKQGFATEDTKHHEAPGRSRGRSAASRSVAEWISPDVTHAAGPGLIQHVLVDNRAIRRGRVRSILLPSPWRSVVLRVLRGEALLACEPLKPGRADPRSPAYREDDNTNLHSLPILMPAGVGPATDDAGGLDAAGSPVASQDFNHIAAAIPHPNRPKTARLNDC